MSKTTNTPTKNSELVSSIVVDISPGELIDKITILEIKSEKLDDEDKLRNVKYELDLMRATLPPAVAGDPEIVRLQTSLKNVNATLWVIEDDIRDCERDKDFSDKFIQIARSVYMENDQRAALKKAINEYCGSLIVEEKSYSEY